MLKQVNGDETITLKSRDNAADPAEGPAGQAAEIVHPDSPAFFHEHGDS